MSETDQRLTWMLRKLADDFGAAGVAKVAAEMIGARVEDLPSECDLHPEDCETDYVLDPPDEAVGHYKLVCLTHDGDHAPEPPDNPEAVQRELDLHADLRVARARVTELEAERDVAQREQARLHESRDRARHLAAELEADNARLTEERDERQHSADWAWRCANGYGERAEAAEARARRAEAALREVSGYSDNCGCSRCQQVRHVLSDAALSDEATPSDTAGLREALERLLEFPNWTYIDGVLTAVVLPEDLRAVLSAHPADAPAGEEELTRYDPHPQDYDDARTGPQASREAAGRDETGSRVSGGGWGLRAALEAAQREQVRLHESRDAAEARARRAEDALSAVKLAVESLPDRSRLPIPVAAAFLVVARVLSAADQTSDATPSEPLDLWGTRTTSSGAFPEAKKSGDVLGGARHATTEED